MPSANSLLLFHPALCGMLRVRKICIFRRQEMEKVMEISVQVRQRGTLTLPADLREKYGIKPGDTFRLVDLEGIFVLTPMVPMVPELAREIERARREAGLSIEELLTGLREQREQYYQEHYGDQATP